MSVKNKIIQLNTRLADTLTEKGVEADASETTTALIDKVAEIPQGSGAADDMLKALTKDGTDFSYLWFGADSRFPTDGTKLPMPNTSNGYRFVGTFKDAVTQQIPTKLDISNAVTTEEMFTEVNADGGVDCEMEYDMSALVLDMRNVVTAKIMFASTYFGKFPTLINIESKLKDAYRMFFNNWYIPSDYVCDALANASGVENYGGTFRMYGGKSIVVNVDSATDCGAMFESCSNLENLTLNGTLKVSLSLASCNKLTMQSVENIIDHLADLTDSTTQVITLHTDIKSQLTDEQIATITNKNWTLA